MSKNSFILQQYFNRLVFPAFPPYPFTKPQFVRTVDADGEPNSGFTNLGATEEAQIMPLGIKTADESDFWILPVEPLIDIAGKNNIIRRNVAKTTDSTGRGTIKERWAQDDYRITIIGYLRNFVNDNDYPRADVEKLRYYCEARQALSVKCPLFEIYNINQIVIEDHEIPHTSGENLQAYTITAYSDNLFELLIETE